MSDGFGGNPGAGRPLGMTLLIGLLGLETLAVIGLSAFLLFELLTEPAASFGGGVAIVLIGVLAAIWLVAILLGALRGRAWIRGAAVTWQLIQIAVAAGFFQGVFARPDLGWLLLIPAVAALGLLLFSSGVTSALRRD